MSTGLWVLLGAVVLALCFGLYRAAIDGRFRGTHRVHGLPESDSEASDQAAGAPADPAPAPESVLAGTAWEDQLGERATLLQFSSAFCAPCRATRRILHDVATSADGVTHLEVDAEHHLDLVRRVGILRTPTTLVLDAAGQELVRATGAPTRQQVHAALAQLDRA
jgi:thiol-disulfide isomerase/thioredoxin